MSRIDSRYSGKSDGDCFTSTENIFGIELSVLVWLTRTARSLISESLMERVAGLDVCQNGTSC